jgi:hypothetical protein
MQKRSSSSSQAKSTKAQPAGKTKAVKAAPSKKKPSDEREYPAARDVTGKATRQEIRRQSSNLNTARSSQRPQERSRQERTHK